MANFVQSPADEWQPSPLIGSSHDPGLVPELSSSSSRHRYHLSPVLLPPVISIAAHLSPPSTPADEVAARRCQPSLPPTPASVYATPCSLGSPQFRFPAGGSHRSMSSRDSSPLSVIDSGGAIADSIGQRADRYEPYFSSEYSNSPSEHDVLLENKNEVEMMARLVGRGAGEGSGCVVPPCCTHEDSQGLNNATSWTNCALDHSEGEIKNTFNKHR